MSEAKHTPVIIVAGMGRCGTTMVMHMLRAGGVPVLSDHETGGLELDATNHLPEEHDWLKHAGGHAVKVLEPQKAVVPEQYPARFIFLTRHHREQAKSQLKLIAHMFPHLAGEIEPQQVAAIRGSLERDEPNMLRSAGGRPSIRLRFERILADPMVAAEAIAEFVGVPFDAAAAAAVVRARPPECAEDLSIELSLLGELAPEESQ